MDTKQSENRKISEQFSQGNFSAAYEHFDDEVQWQIVSDSTMKGKASVIEFCEKMSVEMATATLKNTNIIAAEDRVSIEGECDFTNDKGLAEKVKYCDVYRFENGKIKEITSYCITVKKLD